MASATVTVARGHLRLFGGGSPGRAIKPGGTKRTGGQQMRSEPDNTGRMGTGVEVLHREWSSFGREEGTVPLLSTLPVTFDRKLLVLDDGADSRRCEGVKTIDGVSGS